ncbi:MAG: hypothetical protein ACMX3H_01685 [Sodalis sp. (in: enterobacteria)]|uniref:hypothetical protein n=1 Tax=Sodalis sp. (in: enterobacteria) TaxID=1898979 RepID=UPI0039E5A3F2
MKNDSVITRPKAVSRVHPFIFNIKTTHGLQFYPFFQQILFKVKAEGIAYGVVINARYQR